MRRSVRRVAGFDLDRAATVAALAAGEMDLGRRSDVDPQSQVTRPKKPAVCPALALRRLPITDYSSQENLVDIAGSEHT
jgi:hypothetical protein